MSSVTLLGGCLCFFTEDFCFCELISQSTPRMSCLSNVLQTFDTLRFLFRYSVFKVQNLLLSKQLHELLRNSILNASHSSGQSLAYWIINYPMGLSGLEPPTSRLSGVRSNRLSYKPIVEMEGFEPLTPCLQGRCSPN